MKRAILTTVALLTVAALAVECPPTTTVPIEKFDPNQVNYKLMCIVRVQEGALVIKTLTACDPDGDPLGYSLLESPAGMVLIPGDPNEVLINWTAELGTHYIDVEVFDYPPDVNDTLYDRGSMVIEVRRRNRPPVFRGCR